MAQNLGVMGETYFNYLCSSENINCNKSVEDMAGWDYILDFPLNVESQSSDTAAPPIECKFQIKATTKRRRYWDIKLTNLLRFCKTPLPSFILFMEFDEGKEPERLYLVHFDKELVKRALIAIRTIEQGDTNKKLNSSSMKIKYDESHRLESIDGATLKKKIESFIPSGLGSYSIDKINYANDVGYESGTGILRFSTNDEASFIKMIEASIGLDREIDVSDVVLSSDRFGISLASPLHETKNAILKILPHSNSFDINIRFRDDRFSSPLEFTAKAFYPSIPNLPTNLFRMRIKTAFFELILGFGERASTYEFIMDDGKHSLRDLESQAKLLNWICFDKKKLIVDFISKERPELKNSLMIKPALDEIHSGGGEWIELMNTLEKLIWICNKFSLEPLMRLSINEIHFKEKEISNLYNAHQVKVEDIKFTFASNGDYEDDNLQRMHSTTLPIYLNIAGATMVSIITIQGRAMKNDVDKYALTIENVIYEKNIVSFEDGNEFSQHVESEISELNRRYAEQEMLVINSKKS
ncbi:hypothetical protein [Pantoea vagans]|uniref:hypothetical protein n=1 Tax=Pantoea vagans TaxID=470934 RepID=UPI003B01CED7